MLTSRRRSAHRPQAPKHLLLFGTHLPITTMNPMAQAPPPSCYLLICSQKAFIYLFRETWPQFEIATSWQATFYFIFSCCRSRRKPWTVMHCCFCRPEPHPLPQLYVLNILACQKHIKHTTHLVYRNKQATVYLFQFTFDLQQSWQQTSSGLEGQWFGFKQHFFRALKALTWLLLPEYQKLHLNWTGHVSTTAVRKFQARAFW